MANKPGKTPAKKQSPKGRTGVSKPPVSDDETKFYEQMYPRFETSAEKLMEVINGYETLNENQMKQAKTLSTACRVMVRIYTGSSFVESGYRGCSEDN